MPFVFSTLANDNTYTNYAKERVNDLPQMTERVLIKGKAGIATKNLVTPLGVMTKVSDEELAILERNLTFQQHQKNGFITVKKDKADPEKVASEMQTRDNSGPRVPQDYENKEDGAKPSVKSGGKLRLAAS